MKIVYANKRDYAEIHQHHSIKMSFCNLKDGEYTQMFYGADCRDFFSDVLYAEQTGERINKYEFTYDPAKQFIDKDKVRLLLQFKEKEHKENFIVNLGILRSIEKENKIIKTKVIHVEDKEELIIEGSSFWLRSTFSLHTYTYLLKCMSYEYEDKEKWMESLVLEETNEGKYLKDISVKRFKTLLANLNKVFAKYKTVHGYREEVDVSLVHNFGGVKTLCSPIMKWTTEKVRDNVFVKRFQEVVNAA